MSLSEKNQKGQKEGLIKNTKTSQKKEILELKGSQGLVLKRMGSRLTWNWAFIGDSVNFVIDVKKGIKDRYESATWRSLEP